ncbi:LPXTG cell wall anchor domain-containing protein [Microbacterium amylolyticum]
MAGIAIGAGVLALIAGAGFLIIRRRTEV